MHINVQMILTEYIIWDLKGVVSYFVKQALLSCQELDEKIDTTP